MQVIGSCRCRKHSIAYNWPNSDEGQLSGAVCIGRQKDSLKKDISPGINIYIPKRRVTGRDGCQYHIGDSLEGGSLKRRTRLTQDG